MTKQDLFVEGLKVAKTCDVSTPKDSLVTYSITGQPTKQNRDKAFAYVTANPGAMMIDHTPCGAKLVEMGLQSSDTGLPPENVMLIWKEASRRLIENASGNVTAFVDGATPESVFISMELPQILSNPKITTINGEPKQQFATRLEKEFL